jgi:polyribonucleotide nucleotidyltransferase
VNILPGRDGLLHISKIGGGKRIDRVEDVFNLGDEVEVKVDDVDPNGKVSLSLVGDDAAAPSGGGAPAAESTGGGSTNGGGSSSSSGDEGGSREYVSFEDAFDSEISAELGDLGPAAAEDRGGESRGGGGGRGRGGRSGGGGGRRR